MMLRPKEKRIWTRASRLPSSDLACSEVVADSGHRARFGTSRGVAQIEFILTILVIVFVMFWMWELIMMTYTMNVLSDSAKEGVRYAIVHGCEPASTCSACPAFDTANITARVQRFAKLSFHSMSAMTVSVAGSNGAAGCNRPGYWVRVYVTYPYVPYINLPVRYTLHAAAEGRVVF